MGQQQRHSKDDPPGCNCVDLSVVTDPTSSRDGVYRGPNLTFSSNNNLPEKHNRLQRALRWTRGGSDDVAPGGVIDTKPLRSDDGGDDVAPATSRSYIVLAGAEFLATTLLMFMGCAGAYIEKDKLAANVYGSAAFGLAVFMSSIIFGPISGAHMNPLVTLLSLAFGGIRWTGAVVYMASQTVGALAGYGLLYVVIPPDVQAAVAADAPKGLVCCTIPMDSMDNWSAVLAEFIVTSILLGNVCAGMANPPKNTTTPAFQSGILVAGICTIEAIYTGASMNPARSLSAAIWNGTFDRFWVYLVGQALSLIFVVTLYAVFRTRK